MDADPFTETGLHRYQFWGEIARFTLGWANGVGHRQAVPTDSGDAYARLGQVRIPDDCQDGLRIVPSFVASVFAEYGPVYRVLALYSRLKVGGLASCIGILASLRSSLFPHARIWEIDEHIDDGR